MSRCRCPSSRRPAAPPCCYRSPAGPREPEICAGRKGAASRAASRAPQLCQHALHPSIPSSRPVPTQFWHHLSPRLRAPREVETFACDPNAGPERDLLRLDPETNRLAGDRIVRRSRHLADAGAFAHPPFRDLVPRSPGLDSPSRQHTRHLTAYHRSTYPENCCNRQDRARLPEASEAPGFRRLHPNAAGSRSCNRRHDPLAVPSRSAAANHGSHRADWPLVAAGSGPCP